MIYGPGNARGATVREAETNALIGHVMEVDTSAGKEATQGAAHEPDGSMSPAIHGDGNDVIN